LDGWYDTRLPYVPGCRYEIHRADLNDGKYEMWVGNKVYWYNAGFNNPQSLNADEIGTIKLRINDEADYTWMPFEISRHEPIGGACYAPDFAPLPVGRTICDVPVIQLGDETPAIQQGLNLIAPLFGAQPIRTPPRMTRLPGCMMPAKTQPQVTNTRPPGTKSSPRTPSWQEIGQNDRPPSARSHPNIVNDGKWHRFSEVH